MVVMLSWSVLSKSLLGTKDSATTMGQSNMVHAGDANLSRTPSLFTFLDHKSHFQRRRAVMGVFTQSFLQNNQDIQSLVGTILLRRYLPIIRDHADRKTPLDISEINDASAFDFVTSYIYGISFGTNLLENASFRQTFLGHHYKERSQGFWKHELPFLASLIKRLGFDVTTESARWMQDWFSHAFELSQANLRKDNNGTRAVLLEHLQRSPDMARQSRTQNADLAVVSEAHDHGVAGAETTGQVITNVMLALSQRPLLQDNLRTELLSHSSSANQPMRPVELGRLPLLHAIVIETLRHRDPGPFPRQAPQRTASIAGCSNIPQGTKVTVYPHVIHRDPRVFPSPDDWDPSRWLSDPGLGSPERCGEAGRSFLAFGGGDRTCVARNFAMFEIKALLAAVYSTYKTHLAAAGPHRRSRATGIAPKKIYVMFERA